MRGFYSERFKLLEIENISLMVYVVKDFSDEELKKYLKEAIEREITLNTLKLY